MFKMYGIYVNATVRQVYNTHTIYGVENNSLYAYVHATIAGQMVKRSI